MHKLACCLCGTCKNRVVYRKKEFDIVSCLSCNLVMIAPFPNEKEIREIYGENYYNTWGDLRQANDSLRAMKLSTFRIKLEQIERYIEKGRVLDIGCASGFFLDAAVERGWDAYGVELSSFSAEIARKKYGDKVINGTLHEAGYDDRFFQAVDMSDLLEHVSSPREIL
ncbi:MAG: class I SAM-dependent methyltransferase, partial [bacterium]